MYPYQTVRKQHRKQQRDDPSSMKLPLPTAFGSIIVVDYLKFNSRNEAVGGRNYALCIMDRYTGWTDSFPSVGKSAETTAAAFRQFANLLIRLKTVGLTMRQSLSLRAAPLVTDITFPLRTLRNPMELLSATRDAYWNAPGLHCTTLG